MLDLDHYTPEGGALKMRGKGEKGRVAYLTSEAAVALVDWLRMRISELPVIRSRGSRSPKLPFLNRRQCCCSARG